MDNRPEQVIPAPRSEPAPTAEVGSEGGSPGDMLRPSVHPEPGLSATNRRSGGVPGLLWFAALVPVVLVLLWFLTSL